MLVAIVAGFKVQRAVADLLTWFNAGIQQTGETHISIHSGLKYSKTS